MGSVTIAILIALGAVVLTQAAVFVVNLFGRKKHLEAIMHAYDEAPQTYETLSTKEKDTISNEIQFLQEDFEGQHPGEYLAQLDIEERKKTILNFTNSVLGQYNLNDVEVIIDESEASYCGYYCYSDNRLFINETFLRSDNKYELLDVIDTVLHETRHAYQFATIRGINSLETDNEKVKEWVINYGNYIRPEIDPEAYRDQPLEVDARDWATSVIHSYLNSNNLLTAE